MTGSSGGNLGFRGVSCLARAPQSWVRPASFGSTGRRLEAYANLGPCGATLDHVRCGLCLAGLGPMASCPPSAGPALARASQGSQRLWGHVGSIRELMGTPGWQGSGAHWGPGQLGCACLHVQGPVVQRARPGTMDGFQCALGCGASKVFLPALARGHTARKSALGPRLGAHQPATAQPRSWACHMQTLSLKFLIYRMGTIVPSRE